jgi:glutathione S-transferase
MTDEGRIVLHFARASRSFTPLWLLEELGVPYKLRSLSLYDNEQKSSDYLKINPMGKVPALQDGEICVSESPAICIYLADRYSLGHLAPHLDEVRRGSYLKWMVFSTAVFEPAIYGTEDNDMAAASGRGWGLRSRVLDVLDETLAVGPWLLGDTFTAADVMLGSLLSIALFNRQIEPAPGSLVAYNERLSARPAYQRAAQITWG